LIYAFATIALGVSIYALWTLQDLKEWYESKKGKPGSAWEYYHNPANQKNQKKSTAKGHFDKYIGK
jgi:poly(3-hydroxyalkanoate) synthetase